MENLVGLSAFRMYASREERNLNDRVNVCKTAKGGQGANVTFEQRGSNLAKG
jgi:hypothetical protein